MHHSASMSKICNANLLNFFYKNIELSTADITPLKQILTSWMFPFD